MRCDATTDVEPPTLPAVWTRVIGFPAAPSASARYSSGIITPSKMSGAVPITTASTSFHVICASSSARIAASRHMPANDTSSRTFASLVWPIPTTAQRSAMSASLQDADEVLLQAWSRRRVTERALLALFAHCAECLADAGEAGDHRRVGDERAARRIDRDVVAEPERVAQHELVGRADRGELRE